MRTIHTDGIYRITERSECVDHTEIESLKGDVYDPRHMTEIHGPEMTVEKLKEKEREFECFVEREGVYGYVLEYWNADVGCGWEEIDSCYGFVGKYDPNKEKFNHYIVEEMKKTIETNKNKKDVLDERKDERNA